MGFKILIDNWKGSTILFYLVLQFLHLLKKMGFKTKKDPWRYTTRAYHHLDYCSFGLAAFNLSLPEFKSDQKEIRNHIINQLATFLRRHTIIQKKLMWLKYSVKVLPNNYLDLVLSEFDNSNKLKSIRFFPDATIAYKPNLALVEKAGKYLISAYNSARFESDEKRPPLIIKLVLKQAAKNRENRKEIKTILERMLSAAFVHFESIEHTPASRFKCPEFFQMRPFGFGSLNIHIRILPKYNVDCWVQFNHAVIDGEPAARIIQDIEKTWNAKPVIFPDDKINQSTTDDCILYQCRLKLCVASCILDFEQIVSSRRKLQQLFRNNYEFPITLSGLILWGLGQTEVFKNTKFLIPIDQPKNSQHEQTVGLIYIRPEKFMNIPPTQKQFIDFQKEFNKQIEGTRARTSEQYQVLEVFSLLPHSLYKFSTSFMLKPLQEVVGSSLISVLKTPSFFIAPYATTKTGAAISIGNIQNTLKGGNNLGAVTVKAPAVKIKDYENALVDVVTNYSKYISFAEI